MKKNLKEKNLIKKFLMSGALVLCTGTIGILSPISSNAATDEPKDYTIGEAYWDGSDIEIIAMWDKPEDKTAYKVQLYRGSSKLGSVQSTNAEQYNFTKQIKEKGTGRYYFTVYPSKGGRSLMMTSDVLEIDSDALSSLKIKNNPGSESSAGKAVKQNTTTSNGSGPGTSTSASQPLAPAGPGVALSKKNTWTQTPDKRWTYTSSEGSLVRDSWMLINNLWYCFDAEGYMRTGWIEYKSKWYYCSENGDMLVNTVTPDGYKVDAEGVWIQ